MKLHKTVKHESMKTLEGCSDLKKNTQQKHFIKPRKMTLAKYSKHDLLQINSNKHVECTNLCCVSYHYISDGRGPTLK